jgi:predicted unusual protein kinase regulating ubiquinone biosynthesis (AarF/ABC1/UbiB family)
MATQPSLTPIAPSPGASGSAPISSPRPSPLGRETNPPSVYRAPASGGWRFLRAWATTFLVLGSYTWLSIRSRAFGRAYRAARIAAVHRRNARRVEATILALQGLFIKVGQLLSILANFLPEEFRCELEGLQDQVPPRPFEEIRARIESELGSIEAHFSTFDRNPIASASLGQVHEARLEDGTRVAVKVQHADIDEIVRLDLRTIRRIMMLVQWFVPVQGLDAYYHQIRGLLRQELDFSQEADHIERIARNFKDDERVRFPVPIRSASTRRVLTTSFLEGLKVNDLAGIDALGLDKKDLARRLLRIYCQMIFVDGFYHADPHPGNVLVDAEGCIVLLDFGAVAELSLDMKAGIPEFLEGVLRRDTDRLIRALRRMGFLSRSTDPTVSERIIEYFHRRFQEQFKIESFNLKDIKIDPQQGLANLLDLRKLNIGLKELSGAFHVPKDWVLLERTILLLYGSCSMLDPECNPMAIIQPYLHDFVLGNRDWTRIAVDAAREMALSAVTLPDDIKRYLTKATRGELEVRVRGVQDAARTLYCIGRQLIYTSMAIATSFAGLELHTRGEERPARLLFGAGAVSLVLLAWSSFFGRPRPGG